MLVGTTNADGTGDVSPKGGPPGFVTVLDEHRLAFGELPGNGRVDSYRNLLANPAVGLMFLIPGLGETLRVNGQGYVITDPGLLDQCSVDGKRPKVVLGVAVREAFIHCAKALRRSQLWEPAGWPDSQRHAHGGVHARGARRHRRRPRRPPHRRRPRGRLRHHALELTY